VYSSCRPVKIDAFLAKLAECIGVVSNWMRSNRMQLNSDKTEVIYVQQVDGSNNFQPLHCRSTASRSLRLHPVRNLGIFIDSDLVMRSHIQRTVLGCFATLRQLRQICNLVTTATFQSMVIALVLSRFEYGNSVLVGLPINLVRRLQSVQNAVLMLKVLHGMAPEYFGPVVRVADLPGRQSLRSAGTNRFVVPPFKLSTIGTQAFPVASPHIWNSLPTDITSAKSLSIFRQRLKKKSILTIICSSHRLIICTLSVHLAVTFTYSTLKKQ